MSFKVIDGGGPSKDEREKAQEQHEQARKRERVEGDLSWAVRECAANMLRIIRGAGKPHDLLLQMKKVIDTSITFQEVQGYWPGEVIAGKLRLQDEMEECFEQHRTGALSEASIDLWQEDGTFAQMSAEHTAFCGALQIIASRMIGQKVQESAGDSEFSRGLRELEDVKEKRRRRIADEIRASHSKPPGRKATKKRKLKPRNPSGGIVL